MHDINNHPKQSDLNQQISNVVFDTVNSLAKISKNYEIDEKDLAEQFVNVFHPCLIIKAKRELNQYTKETNDYE